MCFSCAPVAVDCGESHSVRISRIEDPLSTPYETGFDRHEAARFDRGEWVFVGLLGEVLDASGSVVRQDVVWGVREDDEQFPCAFGFTDGVAWLLERLALAPQPATVGP